MASEQRSLEWHAERVGKLTASRMADAMAWLKSGKGMTKVRSDLLCLIAAGRITGQKLDADISNIPAVRHGIENEEQAKNMLAIERGILGEDCGLILHPTIEHLGASPDFIYDGCPVEIKCPNPSTHMRYLSEKVVPEEYRPQMALQCLCLGVENGIFASFDPRFPEHLRLFMCEFKPGKEYLKLVESEAIQFLKEVEEVVKQMENLKCHQ